MDTILITGGAGFIGSNLVRQWLAAEEFRVVVLDKFTYAGSRASLPPDSDGARLVVEAGDIADMPLVQRLLSEYKPRAIVNLAAESHVDRSIDGPAEFVQTNVVGTGNLLDQAMDHFRNLRTPDREAFRFLHVSTDEVYGSLGPTGSFDEQAPYAPNSPYAASKASSDMFVRAYHKTFGLPTQIINCSNNYGPYQFPEKLIPLMLLNALEGKPLPVYGDGQNVRDWIFVADHCRAIDAVLREGRAGEMYNIGGDCERSNLEVVETVCDLLDELAPTPRRPSRQLISFVEDRPGHDRRYAVDASKAHRELGWEPLQNFEDGVRITVQWYLENMDWVRHVTSGTYQRERLGLMNPPRGEPRG